MNVMKSNWLSVSELIPLLELGDLVEIDRENLYRHWAVVVQRENHTAYVIHLMGDDESLEQQELPVNRTVRMRIIADLKIKLMGSAKGGCAQVKCDDLLEVVCGNKCRVNNDVDGQLHPFPPNEIVNRALNQLGCRKYNLLFSNCEHFAKWCRYGSKRSQQASKAKSVLIGLTAIAVGGSVSNGLVAGLVGYGACYVGNMIRHSIATKYQLCW